MSKPIGDHRAEPNAERKANVCVGAREDGLPRQQDQEANDKGNENYVRTGVVVPGALNERT